MVHNISISQTTIIAGVVTTTAVVLGTYYYNRARKNRIPIEWTPVGKIKELNIFPLKSGKRNEVMEAEVTERGLVEKDKLDGSLRLKDRVFVVYKEKNLEHRTGRQLPKLVLVSVKSYNADSAIFEAPNMRSPLIVKIPNFELDNVVKIKHHRSEIIHSRDCGDEAAKWISECLQSPGLRLACHDGKFLRKQLAKIFGASYKETLRPESCGLNTDLAAVHLVNEASSNQICNLLGIPEICTKNFRSNILVSGPNLKPFAEDNWEWLKIGDVVMRNVGDCTRCIMVTINQENGIKRADNEPLKVLKKYHGTGKKNEPVMGIFLDVYRKGMISVGDTVYVSQ